MNERDRSLQVMDRSLERFGDDDQPPPPRVTGIICTAWTPLHEPRGKLAGYSDLYIVKLKLRLFGCPVFRCDDGRVQVGLPARNIAKLGETPEWQPCVAWDRIEDRQAYEAVALDALLLFAPDLDGGGQ